MDTPTVYCEFLKNGNEYINAFSSLAFIIAGGAIFFFAKKKQHLVGKILAFLLIFLGFSSGYWHFFSTPLGDILDTLAITFFIFVLIWELLKKHIPKKQIRIILCIGLALLSFYLESLPFLNGSLVYIFLFTLIGGLSIPYTRGNVRSTKLLWIFALLSGFIGIYLRIIDSIQCNDLIVGTHFIWHILIALASLFIAIVVIDSPKNTSS